MTRVTLDHLETDQHRTDHSVPFQDTLTRLASSGDYSLDIFLPFHTRDSWKPKTKSGFLFSNSTL